ncbi:quaternary amine ABC transporter ATP-binding protein [Desertibacillus haloalkaliphilus]|uniref:quaternary amine ABC transporter ATP-binding protein n=1 Tax=Desertibacillus haloalkaliphilus TaxID=1328930 RepID=UPI001C253110|nr:glycine betaine/L-proline ABC transporter ATP-binding protein [Desertibacillus haloalkaliphilus]MBU8906797.1 glycine betaine/L-proline ABC transporter ATP-binding protein [Desertibacillus haloalkaliphilus]
MKKIEVSNLTKVFGSNPEEGLERVKNGEGKDQILEETGMTVGVNNASFTVEQGEFFVIMGLSGSGKSTLIRLINRLIEPTSGEILIDGDDIAQADQQSLTEMRRKKLGMVFQKFALFPHRTVLANVEFGLEIQHVPKEEREKLARQAIEDVGLAGYEDSYPDQLSGGMQQRVGLARALSNNTDILLMDEAFSALDPLIRTEMQDELLYLQKKLGKTILFITHDLDEALKLGDRIAIMKDGGIVQIGTSEEILEFPANDYVASFVNDVDRSRVLEAAHVMTKPQAVVTWSEGASVAVKKMQEAELSSIFVVDDKGQLKGLLTYDKAVEGMNQSSWEEDLLVHDFATTKPNTPLHQLFGVAADTKHPIAVVQDDKLIGVVVKTSILAGLDLGKTNRKEEVIA